MIAHPAKYSTGTLEIMSSILYDRFGSQKISVLDPFAGIGGIHELNCHRIVGVELEPEYATQHPNTVIGNATCLQFADNEFEAIVTSPCYGNRMADQYLGDPKGSARHTYAISLGRRCTDGSGAAMQWGSQYRSMHTAAIVEMRRVLVDDGLAIINISDHVRDGSRQEVEAWWTKAMLANGFRVWRAQRHATRRQLHGSNRELRVSGELIIAFETTLHEGLI